jgi:hypothetical protein
MVVSTEDMKAIGAGVAIGTLLPLGLKRFADPEEKGLRAESLKSFQLPSAYISLATGVPLLLLGAAGFMGKGPVKTPIYQEAMIGYGIPAVVLGSVSAAKTHEELAGVAPTTEMLGISPEERAFVATYP